MAAHVFRLFFSPHFCRKKKPFYLFAFAFVAIVSTKTNTHFLAGNNKIYEYFFLFVVERRSETRISVYVILYYVWAAVHFSVESNLVYFVVDVLSRKKIGSHFIGVCCLCVIIFSAERQYSESDAYRNCKKKVLPASNAIHNFKAKVYKITPLLVVVVVVEKVFQMLHATIFLKGNKKEFTFITLQSQSKSDSHIVRVPKIEKKSSNNPMADTLKRMLQFS